MNSRNFSLKPFPSTGLLPLLGITGNIGRSSNTIAITYTLLGPLSELLIPAPAEMPARKNALWEETCFEFFLALKNSDRYWEFNLSPSGHWNVFSFNSYRQGMREEPTLTTLPFSVYRQPDALRLSVKLDLAKIIPEDQTLQIAISAVIKALNGKITCWALTHPGPQADFHRRDGFILDLNS
jgi:hypothetical protein